MKDLENTIKEVASNLSEKTISTTQRNVDALVEELADQNGIDALKMIAWDQQ
jgi:hypothetical protein